jgi:protein-ribulosamine 3-kinase
VRAEIDWNALADSAHAAGIALEPARARRIAGGCIHESFRVEARGGPCFVKVNDGDQSELFAAEADGLQALARTELVRVPAVLAQGETGNLAYIVLEWIDLTPPDTEARRLLGTQLAALHRCTNERYGWHRDNAIGRTPQQNHWSSDWVEFFSERRIGYQLEMAARHGYGAQLQTRGNRLLAALSDLFADYRPSASLLHGDLWGGNWATLHSDEPVLFDPALYYGDREADLAMTELFGGFPRAFYAAYEEVWPLDEGYGMRKHLYNLYHLLNHLNLFGGAYLGQVRATLGLLLRGL